MSHRTTIVHPSRIAPFAMIALAAAAMLTLAACHDSKSDSSSGSTPSDASPASGSGSRPSGR